VEEYYDEELEAIKRKKLLEYQRKLRELMAAEERRRIEEARREQILRRILSPEARQRLANLRMIRPELVERLEEQLIALATSGRLKVPLSDEELKNILASLARQTRREYRIRYVPSG